MKRRWRYMMVIVLAVLAGVVWVAVRESSRRVIPGTYLQADLGGTYVEAPPHGLLRRFVGERRETLLELLDALHRAGTDDRIEGVVVRVTPLAIGWAKAQEIRDALLELRARGKRVVGVLEQESIGGSLEYFVASATQPLFVVPSSTTPLNGLSAQFLFLGGVWEKLDIEMNVEKIREYKTAGDMFAYKEMTAAHREMASALLDSLSGQFVDALANVRGLDASEVRTWIDRAPSTGTELEAAHLCDGVKHLQDVKAELSPDRELMPLREYMAKQPRRPRAAARIAVVFAEGNIVTGNSGGGPGADVVGADTLRKALEEAQDADDIGAIILRVDSPGGSPLASDLIWRATQSARKRKPVIVSMSDVAASGGYYIAAGADKIVAQPGTMTGSIGVVFLRPNIRGLLHNLGIHVETMTRGRFADLGDLTTTIDSEGRARLLADMQHVYDVFVDRVADGRKLTTQRVDEIGRGRVWTGIQAKEQGLVDELGGFRVAEKLAKELIGVDVGDEVELILYPRASGFFGDLSDLFENEAEVTIPRLLRRASRAVLLPFEESSVLTLMPIDVEIR